MKKPIELSNCCHAPIRVSHGCDSDFDHNGKPCDCTEGTMWYECSQCKKPCDIAISNDKKRCESRCEVTLPAIPPLLRVGQGQT